MRAAPARVMLDGNAVSAESGCGLGSGGVRGVLCVPGHHRDQRARSEVLQPRWAWRLLPEARGDHRFRFYRRGGLRAELPASGGSHRACFAAGGG